jgi:hypothetical protein
MHRNPIINTNMKIVKIQMCLSLEWIFINSLIMGLWKKNGRDVSYVLSLSSPWITNGWRVLVTAGLPFGPEVLLDIYQTSHRW